MTLVAVKNKYQIVIPAKVRKEAGIKVGDLLEAKFERGKVTFVPKALIDRGIAESLEDIQERPLFTVLLTLPRRRLLRSTAM